MSSTLLTAWLLGTALAAKGPCEAQRATLAQASPGGVADAFVALATCDQAVARAAAPEAFGRLQAVTDPTGALVTAIEIGSGREVLTWLSRQEVDARSRAIAKLGSTCPDHPAVGGFFVEVRGAIGDAFFVDRWHRGLVECRTDDVRGLLEAALEHPELGRPSRSRTQYYSLLEVYARNLRATSIPRLATFLAEARDEEEALQLVGTFPDAANIGGAGGTDEAAATAAIAAIVAAAPTLPRKAIDRARGALSALGAPDAASSLAKYYWPDRLADGTYTYGFYAIEDITCRNGSKRAILHHTTVTEPGGAWPEELAPRVEKELAGSFSWGASKCGGTNEVQYVLTPEPLAGDAGLDAWRKTLFEEFGTRFGGVKTWIVAEDGFGF